MISSNLVIIRPEHQSMDEGRDLERVDLEHG